MTVPKQQTLAAEATFEGIGIHTGEAARLRLVPADADSGIRFRRVDLDDAPEIPASIDHVVSTERGTTLALGGARVHTVEHLLAAAAGLGIDNLVIEIDGPEVPIGDGSFLPFLDLMERAGLIEQGERAEVQEITSPLTVDGPAGAPYGAAPHAGPRFSATIECEHPVIVRPYHALDLHGNGLVEAIASALRV